MKPLLFVLLAFAVSNVLAVDTNSIERCRRVADPAARLKCYDEIPLSPSRPAEEPDRKRAEDAPKATARPSGPSTDGIPSRSNADPTTQFGLESRLQPGPVPDSIESSIPGRFEGWVGNSRIRLSNGQVWEIRDGSQASYDLQDPKVRIVRGLSGTFFIEIAGVSQTPRVRRVE